MGAKQEKNYEAVTRTKNMLVAYMQCRAIVHVILIPKKDSELANYLKRFG